MEISDVMKKPIVIIKDMSLSDAARLMTKQAISSLLFMPAEVIAGILTAQDLVAHFGQQKNVSEIMSRQVVTVRKSDKIQRAIDLMRDHRISILPVVDKGNKLVGIIHAKDILHQACDNEEFLIE